MAEPTGPTVAKDPDELDGTDSSPTPTDAAGATTSSPGSPEDGSTGETTVEDGDSAVDATGTVAPATAPSTEPDANGTADADAVTPSEPASGEDPSSAPVVDTAEHRTDEATPSKGDPTDPTDADDADDGEERDDEDDLEGDDGSEQQSGGLLTKKFQLDARAVLLVVVVVALAAGAYVIGQRSGKDLVPAATSGGTTATTTFTIPKDFVGFEDKETGIKLALPKDWPQFSTKELDPSYRLLLGVPNAKDTLRVRVNAYSSEVTQANIGDQKAVIDAIFAGEKVNILADQPLTLNGMPALFYVYKFTDATGEPGIHAHFFVFQGKKMVTMVFESVPESRYPLLAPVFDQIKDSLVVAPGPPPAFLEALTSGTPSATTVPGGGAPTTATPATTAAPPTSTP